MDSSLVGGQAIKLAGGKTGEWKVWQFTHWRFLTHRIVALQVFERNQSLSKLNHCRSAADVLVRVVPSNEARAETQKVNNVRQTHASDAMNAARSPRSDRSNSLKRLPHRSMIDRLCGRPRSDRDGRQGRFRRFRAWKVDSGPWPGSPGTFGPPARPDVPGSNWTLPPSQLWEVDDG